MAVLGRHNGRNLKLIERDVSGTDDGENPSRPIVQLEPGVSFSELLFLFAVINFRDVVPTSRKVERRLRNLPLPPSRMHHAGDGIEALWLLDRPIPPDEMAEGEVILRRLANHLGGAPLVAFRGACLSVPGTLRLLRSAGSDAFVVRTTRAGDERYSVHEIAAWLKGAGEPGIQRRRNRRAESNAR
jgi:hypothetical protein